MKLLTISTGSLDLNKSYLIKPFNTIGRSPVCDLVLRSPGIKPIHFIVEWIGSGPFRADEGEWALIDISRNKITQDSAIDHMAEGEGVILTSNPVQMGDYIFKFIEDALESTPEIGGLIQKDLRESTAIRNPEILEVLRVKSDTGAIEDVRHLVLGKKRRVQYPFQATPQFQILWEKKDGRPAAQLLIADMEGALLLNRGNIISDVKQMTIEKNDLLKVQWEGWEFYTRFVDKIKTPPIPHQFFGDTRIKKSFFTSLALFLFLTWMVITRSNDPIEKKFQPVRVVKIEIAPPPPPAPPIIEKEAIPEKTVTPDPEVEVAEVKPVEVEVTKPIDKVPTEKPPKKETNVKAVRKPDQLSKTKNTGLIKEAPTKEIGVFGALIKKTSKQVAKIDATEILQEESLTGSSNSEVVKKEVLAPNKSNLLSPLPDTPSKSKQSESLKAASSKISPKENKETGNISNLVPTKKSGTPQISKFPDEDESLSTGSSKPGLNIEDIEFKVRGGGLDRETVRQVIRPYRGAIKTCYEKALLTQPKVEGKITFRWEISMIGKVSQVTVQKVTVKSKQLESCVQGIIQSMVFPEAPNGLSTIVIYPFVFQASK